MVEMREQESRFGADVRTEGVDELYLAGPIDKTMPGEEVFRPGVVLGDGIGVTKSERSG